MIRGTDCFSCSLLFSFLRTLTFLCSISSRRASWKSKRKAFLLPSRNVKTTAEKRSWFSSTFFPYYSLWFPLRKWTLKMCFFTLPGRKQEYKTSRKNFASYQNAPEKWGHHLRNISLDVDNRLPSVRLARHNLFSHRLMILVCLWRMRRDQKKDES